MEWISVKTRLPEPNTAVLGRFEDDSMLVVRYMPNCGCEKKWHGDNSRPLLPAHWMPLPEPPK